MLRRLVTIVAFVLVNGRTVMAGARSAVQRDVEGYAVATCLASQKQPYLKDQGDGWASAIVQRSHGKVSELNDVAAAVKAEMAGGHVGVIHVDGDPPHDEEAPILYCAEIVDAPRVATAIDKAIKKLAPAYRQPKK